MDSLPVTPATPVRAARDHRLRGPHTADPFGYIAPYLQQASPPLMLAPIDILEEQFDEVVDANKTPIYRPGPH